ncbi:MAG: aspartate--tRNA ligase [Alphaproteobacteria bacterium]|nr:aspartate--tRNA ligase [Alphaproteobacteria bacterium]
MAQYRTHSCGELNAQHVGKSAKIAGWIHKKRDHGSLLFIDLRDHKGLTQCVIDKSDKNFKMLENLRVESVISLEGEVLKRTPETINKDLKTGEIELKIQNVEIHSSSEILPIQVAGDEKYPEDLRLKYRYIDLRREKLRNNILMRDQIIRFLRQKMWGLGFNELQTPILTASSPEGARDFLVPSRMHKGKFYALPQAPQQFKQLAMVAGFDKYFQIAPCFRDEDTRADRVLEFYQLDMEMAFATQEDVFAVANAVIPALFEAFKGKKTVEKNIPYIPFEEAMERYGSDKPDMRNPLEIFDTTQEFKDSSFTIFSNLIERGFVVKAIPAPKTSDRPRSFFDKLNSWAQDEGAKGLGYITFADGESKGPIAKNLDIDRILKIKAVGNLQDGDSVFFVCAPKKEAQEFAGKVRAKLGNELDLIDPNIFKFCWIVDYPLYEYDEENKKIDFSHNPFSMPRGGLEALNTKDPLDILADQYDLVCNGFELLSGAVRNHRPDIMYRAFEIAGYKKEVVEERFGGMLNAFKYGAPPHAGCAPGIDRMVMLLADEPNLREVILFPINQRGEDLMMGAPALPENIQLKELGLKIDIKKN